MTTNVSVGIDIGSQKTMISKDDADIIRTDTGKLLLLQIAYILVNRVLYRYIVINIFIVFII